jgi:hypothetical protein
MGAAMKSMSDAGLPVNDMAGDMMGAQEQMEAPLGEQSPA